MSWSTIMTIINLKLVVKFFDMDDSGSKGFKYLGIGQVD